MHNSYYNLSPVNSDETQLPYNSIQDPSGFGPTLYLQPHVSLLGLCPFLMSPRLALHILYLY